MSLCSTVTSLSESSPRLTPSDFSSGLLLYFPLQLLNLGQRHIRRHHQLSVRVSRDGVRRSVVRMGEIEEWLTVLVGQVFNGIKQPLTTTPDKIVWFPIGLVQRVPDRENIQKVVPGSFDVQVKEDAGCKVPEVDEAVVVAASFADQPVGEVGVEKHCDVVDFPETAGEEFDASS